MKEERSYTIPVLINKVLKKDHEKMKKIFEPYIMLSVMKKVVPKQKTRFNSTQYSCQQQKNSYQKDW